MKKILVLISLVLFLSSCQGLKSSNQPKSSTQDNIGYDIPLARNEEGYVDFTKAIKSGHIVIAKFGLDICIGCIEANKIMISLMPTYDKAIYFSKVDMMEDRSAEKKYNIKMMPTIIFFDKSGKEFHRIEGEISREAIVEKLESFCWSY